MLKVFIRDALPDALDAGCLVMSKVSPGQNFKQMTLEGHYQCNEIVLGGKTVAVIWWYKGRKGGMFIEAVASIGNNSVTWDCILEAVDIIVMRNNFKFVDVEAVRLGMVCKLNQAGYKTTGVMMRRNY